MRPRLTFEVVSALRFHGAIKVSWIFNHHYRHETRRFLRELRVSSAVSFNDVAYLEEYFPYPTIIHQGLSLLSGVPFSFMFDSNKFRSQFEAIIEKFST
jgi:hypothetical protein